MDNLINNQLLNEICSIIETARFRSATYVNSTMVMTYWEIGNRIYTETLKKERGEYGEQIIKQLAKSLSLAYGKGFNSRALFRMVRFARLYSDKPIVETLSPLLSWSHFIELIGIEEDTKRDFYTQMCRYEYWSVRSLRKKIDSMLFERTVISSEQEKSGSGEVTRFKRKEFNGKGVSIQRSLHIGFLAITGRL